MKHERNYQSNEVAPEHLKRLPYKERWTKLRYICVYIATALILTYDFEIYTMVK